MSRILNFNLGTQRGLLGIAAAATLATTPYGARAESDALRVAKQLNSAFIEVADKVSPSVVVILVSAKSRTAMDDEPEMRQFRRFFGIPEGQGGGREQLQQGEGSGVIIRPDGYIVTNNHVVDGAEKIKVRMKDGREFDAEVKGTFADADIAVIKLKGKVKDLPVAKFADSDKVRVGEFAIAVGAPFELDYSVTYGHVSAKGRGNLMGGPSNQDFIQTDASINPGNSGGPLVNLDGEIIGINAMIRGIGTGIGFAIPANIAHDVADRIITDGKFTPSWIGVELGRVPARDVSPDTYEGVVVNGIAPDGPASKSKLEPGDIITAVDGKKVNSVTQLRAEVARKPPGQEVKLSVVRESKNLEVAVTPQPWPEELDRKVLAKRNGGPGPSSAVVDGARLKLLTGEAAAKAGVKSGVEVVEVEEGGAAADQGLQAGDIITDVNGTPVKSVKEVRQALADAKDSGARLRLVRDGERRFLFYKTGSE
jgi:serine protease Do